MGTMEVRGRAVEPAASVQGAIAVPGVTAISQRAVLLGAVAEGESEISGFGRTTANEAAVRLVRALGAEVGDEGGEVVTVRGVGFRGLREPDGPLDVAGASRVIDLAAGILAGQNGRFVLSGDAVAPDVAEPLREMGARVETSPVVIAGGRLKPIRYMPRTVNGDVKSAVLFAGLYADGGPTTVVERTPSPDHGERLLRELSVRVVRRGAEVSVSPVERLASFRVEIAGDFAAAAPFIVAATLLHGSELLVEGVNVNPLRTGLLDVLGRMGANIAVFNRRTVSGEPVADLEVRPAELLATVVRRRELSRLGDELPLVALAAGVARGESIVWGLDALGDERPDWVETVTNALKTLGVRVTAGENGGLRVRGVPTRPKGGGAVDTRGDHRIAMLAAVGGLVSRAGVRIEGAESAAVSFPGFFDLLETVTQR
jgi:3-phosphoshikimate 1-carboxyvinyltransferase